ncbi:hypothetical protein OHA71_32900 [Streptomyces sp. NBC_00444]|uniref:hypothetical protein n=1 Tax=Streptomyces sp. NBC_00444 TaxID=2975744 RepID=UPI002E1CC4AC
MARIAFDSRLVQTAVIGSKNSEQPIILPMEPDELEVHRRRHPTYAYYCGIQLGGCGGQLADRLYRDGRVCHFAHHPDPDGTHPVCHRTANGEDSADHLFIKQGVTRWLNKQNIRSKTKLRNLGRGPGDAVDIHLPDTRHRIRFHLTPGLDVSAWRQADEELTEDADTVDWVLTDDSSITRELLSRHGYCLRVRCETDGAERRVHIGAQHPGHPIDWTPLEDCTLTPAGLLTPAVESIRLTRPKPRPVGFLLQGEPVFTVTTSTQAPAFAPSDFTADERQVILADVKPTTDSRVVRAFVSLPRDVPAPTPGNVFRFTGAVRLLVTDSNKLTEAQWALEADKFVRLDAQEARRTGPCTPTVSSPATVNTQKLDRPQQQATPAQVSRQTNDAQPNAKALQPQRSAARSPAVAGLHKALKRVAELGSTTTWESLIGMVGLDVAHLAGPMRRNLLVAVDDPVSDAYPLLSVLIRERNSQDLSYMGTILKMHGLQIPGGEETLRRWCARERERAYAFYGNPQRTMPPRLGAGPVEAQPREQPGRQARSKGVLESSLGRLEERILEAQLVLEETRHQERRRQLAKTIKNAQGAVSSYRRALKQGTAYMKWLGGNSKSPRDYEVDLQGAIKAARAARSSRKKRTQRPG